MRRSLGLADSLARLPPPQRAAFLASLSPDELEAVVYDWSIWARPNQMPPKSAQDGSDWNTWCILAGRGYGKTRTGAEWTRSIMCGDTPLTGGWASRIAIIGETSKDVRDVLVEGDSGLLAVHPKAYRPHYEPSKSRVTWPNGGVATLYNGTEPDQLRGPQFGAAWIDELAKFRYAQETWDMLQFGLRLGDHPRVVVTTTPRPIALLKAILANPKTAITRGSTYENAENLAESFLAEMKRRYEGTRLGRQELSAELIEDDPNALWRRELFEEQGFRRHDGLPDMTRVVVSVDPAAKSEETRTSEEGAETGIVATSLGSDGKGYVLDDLSCAGGPNEWGRRAVSAYDRHEADLIVAEQNNGGDMVRHVIQSVRPNINVKLVTASRGKVTRAEPVAALYEQRRVHHVGSFPVLEDQMAAFNNINPQRGVLKDRVDALVWGFTEVFPQLVATKRKKWVDKWSRNKGGSWMGA